MTRSAPQTSPQTAGAPQYISVARAAEIAGTHRNTIQRWVAEGRFSSARPIASGSSRRRIDLADFLRFLRGEVTVGG